jgi:hypothetical protein
LEDVGDLPAKLAGDGGARLEHCGVQPQFNYTLRPESTHHQKR